MGNMKGMKKNKELFMSFMHFMVTNQALNLPGHLDPGQSHD